VGSGCTGGSLFALKPQGSRSALAFATTLSNRDNTGHLPSCLYRPARRGHKEMKKATMICKWKEETLP